MHSSERHAFILKELESAGTVRVTELAAKLKVDLVTIRRDLAQLETQGLLQRIHGGARLNIITEHATNRSENRIAEAAARFIPENSTLFLGPGPLTLELVPFLTGRAHLTIITNALDVAWNVARQRRHSLHLLGGQAADDYGLYGESTALESIRADWIILEGGGLDAERGFTHDRQSYARLARQLLTLGGQVISLIPPQRVGHAAAVFIAPAEELDVLITGREASNAALWDLSELGIRIVLT